MVGSEQELSHQLVRKYAKERGMYETPDLNESLLVHNLGIQRMSDKLLFSNVTCLFLENNCLRSLAGVDKAFPKLRYLNVNHNLLDFLDICLEGLEELHACHNHIAGVRGDRAIRSLRVMRLAYNKLCSVADLSEFKRLEVLDLSYNHIIASVEELVKCIPSSVLQLYLSPNPFIAHIPLYRQTILAAFPTLVFLDTEAVTESSRAIAQAQLVGGKDAAADLRRQHGEAIRKSLAIQLGKFRDFQASYSASEYELDQLRREIKLFTLS